VDSCFLCVIGGSVLPNPGKRIASEGFGTCQKCSVHACQVHGDRLQGPFFWCADCLARVGLITAVTAVPPSAPADGGAAPVNPVTHEILGRGDSLFRAIAPGATAGAAPLVADADLDAMAAALVNLPFALRQFELGALGAQFWASAPPEDVRRVIGLPPDYQRSDDYSREQRDVDDLILGADVLRVSGDALQLEAQDWTLRAPEDMPAQAELAAWALSTAYAARGAATLRTSPFALAGGLRLPPLALLLAVTYQNQVSS
jgi:hypothetical protein